MEPSEEIQRVVERWLAAVDARDPDAVGARISDHAGIVMIGTDAREWFAGPNASSVLKRQMEGAGGYPLTCEEISAWEEGSCGWASAKIQAEWSGVVYDVRLTCVLHLERGDWKIVQAHMSLPQANESVGAPETKTFEELERALLRERPDISGSLATDGTVTIVFTDIVDSTVMLSRLGDAAWLDVIRRHNDVIREVTEAHGGTVVETQGDGSMLAFSTARGAVACARALQEEIERAFVDFSPPIRIRIGIHTGDAIHEADHFFGTTVHYAARVAGQAVGGEVLVSSLVHDLVGDDGFLEGREVELKGLEGRHRLYALAPA
jgi:class 3 adenylate cyclase/ketosteroid isomerase-like protein